MSPKLARLVEAERRGILTGPAREALLEARRRGLVAEPRDAVAEAVREASSVSAQLTQAVMQLAARPAPSAPEVSVRPVIKAEPQVVVQQAAQHAWRFEIERDRYGNILAVTARAERE